MMLPVYSLLDKKVVQEVDFDLSLITDLEVSENFVSQYISRMDSYFHRERKAKTRNQSEVSGTTAKPYRQKGTGNARQGTKRGAQHTGGGTMFGPRGMSFKVSVPKGEVKLVKRILLSLSLSQGRMHVIDNCTLQNHKTKTTVALAHLFANENPRVLVLHDDEVSNDNLLSCRNLRYIKYAQLKDFQVNDLLRSNCLLITKKALSNLLYHF